MIVADQNPRATVPTPPATLSNASGFRARGASGVASPSEGREEAGPGGPSYASTSYSESLSEEACSRHASSFGSDVIGGVISSRSLPYSSANAAANAFAAATRPRGGPSGATAPSDDASGIRHALRRDPCRRRAAPRDVGTRGAEGSCTFGSKQTMHVD